MNGAGRLVVGGKLKAELWKVSAVKEWLDILRANGRLRQVNDSLVGQTEKDLGEYCRSDDPHVIALACVSGARLLYTNDSALIEDFKNPRLLSPRGRVYTTDHSAGTLTKAHRDLLERKDLCRPTAKRIKC